MNLDSAASVSRAGLTAFAQRAAVHATNLANVETTRTADGGPFVPLEVALTTEPTAAGGLGVRADVADSAVPPVPRFDPAHPHADASGFIHLPGIDLSRETTSLAIARRLYEANLGAAKLSTQMNLAALDLAR